MNRGIKSANKLRNWLFRLAWYMTAKRPEWLGRILYRIVWALLRFVSWFGKTHSFNPWTCDSCRFEAECGYESASEKEIADAWRREQ